MHHNHEYELALIQKKYLKLHHVAMTMWDIIAPFGNFMKPKLKYSEHNGFVANLECPIRDISPPTGIGKMISELRQRKTPYDRLVDDFNGIQTFGDYRVRLSALSTIESFLTDYKRACVYLGLPVPLRLKSTRDVVVKLRRDLKKRWEALSKDENTDFSHGASKNTLTPRKKIARVKLLSFHKKPEDLFLYGNAYCHHIISFVMASQREDNLDEFVEDCLDACFLRTGLGYWAGFSQSMACLPEEGEGIKLRAYRIGLKQAIEFQRHFARWAKLTQSNEVKKEAAHLGYMLHRLRTM